MKWLTNLFSGSWISLAALFTGALGWAMSWVKQKKIESQEKEIAIKDDLNKRYSRKIDLIHKLAIDDEKSRVKRNKINEQDKILHKQNVNTLKEMIDDEKKLNNFDNVVWLKRMLRYNEDKN